jgi:hypothetical protein
MDFKVRSGQTTVTTAGTEVPLSSSGYPAEMVAIRALSTNTGKMYIGNDGSGAVSSSTGYELSAGDQVVLMNVGALDTIMVDASVNGQKVCWLILG